MTWPCSMCGTTEPGHRIGRSCLCSDCDRIASAKAAEHFNRVAEERALTKTRHPSGKGPRYRSSLLWRQCTCHWTGSPCWHGGDL